MVTMNRLSDNYQEEASTRIRHGVFASQRFDNVELLPWSYLDVGRTTTKVMASLGAQQIYNCSDSQRDPR